MTNITDMRITFTYILLIFTVSQAYSDNLIFHQSPDSSEIPAGRRI